MKKVFIPVIFFLSTSMVSCGTTPKVTESSQTIVLSGKTVAPKEAVVLESEQKNAEEPKLEISNNSEQLNQEAEINKPDSVLPDSDSTSYATESIVTDKIEPSDDKSEEQPEDKQVSVENSQQVNTVEETAVITQEASNEENTNSEQNDNSTTGDIYHKELEEIIEPEIIDLEPPEEAEEATENSPQNEESETQSTTAEEKPADEKNIEVSAPVKEEKEVPVEVNVPSESKPAETTVSGNGSATVTVTVTVDVGNAQSTVTNANDNITPIVEVTVGNKNDEVKPEEKEPSSQTESSITDLKSENQKEEKTEKIPAIISGTPADEQEIVPVPVDIEENSSDINAVENETPVIVETDEPIAVIDETEPAVLPAEDGVIDILDDEDIADDNDETEEVEIIPSRSVTVNKSEYIDITYPGTGWIYIGLVSNTKEVSYSGRSTVNSTTKFSLQAKKAGKVIAHFYKNDALENDFLDDYIEIEILDVKGSNKTHIDAPEYKAPLPKVKENNKTAEKNNNTSQKAEKNTPAKKESTEKKPSAEPSTKMPSGTVKISEPQYYISTGTTEEKAEPEKTVETYVDPVINMPDVDTDSILKEALQFYNNKQYKEASEKLNLFFEFSTTRGDEALFLRGQILESNSDIQDIPGAINAYTTLTTNYPASKYWDTANKRIIYLNRFYMEGR